MPSILASYANGGFLLPREASTYAGSVDWLFHFILWVSIFFFVLIGVLMVFFAVKYRQTDKNVVAVGATHSTALEITWTVIPIILTLAMFYWGFKGFMNMTTPPSNKTQITVTAYQWGWLFTYPNGATDSQLYIPADRPVQFVLESRDVIHSLFVPAFRMKKDVVPGRYNKAWVQSPWIPRRARVEEVSKTAGGSMSANPPERIQYDMFCSQYCGNNHSKMGAPKYHVYVYRYADWKRKIASLKRVAAPIPTGKKVHDSYCGQCHSTDGTRGIGPSWKDVYGGTVTFSDGSKAKADDNYIHESILYPNRKIVAGFQPQMPSFKGQLSDQQINGVIEYMKSISKNYHGKLLKSWNQGKGKGQSKGQGKAKTGESGGAGGGSPPSPQGKANPNSGSKRSPDQGQDQDRGASKTGQPVALARPIH